MLTLGINHPRSIEGNRLSDPRAQGFAMAKRSANTSFYKALKARSRRFSSEAIGPQFAQISRTRVYTLAQDLSDYISTNLPAAIERKRSLADYRTNPYVLMTSASVLKMDEPNAFAAFLFNSKLYMALETSFGKSVEAAFVRHYPIGTDCRWTEAEEKLAESAALSHLSSEEKARRRTTSVWREIDKSCVVGNKRYLTSIKSGPNTINDTQVQAMTRAIIENHEVWLSQTRLSNPSVTELDIVLGLTYGTDKTTNNKENQILVKLMEHGFEEEDRAGLPGVLIDSQNRRTRVYRRIGQDFWSFIGRPDRSNTAGFVYLEVLLALAMALSQQVESDELEDRINRKLSQLSGALERLQFPRRSLPEWIKGELSEDELFWFATAMTAFFDEGI